MSLETINYYNENAPDFAAATDDIDMTALYAEFLPRLNAASHILDAGCGSGRDAVYFKQQGFTVSAFDASAELARLASSRPQQAVAVQRFEQLNEHEKYDGIWCCASLLHVANNNLAAVFGLLQQALKPKGVLYASFKYGDTERQDHGRHFTDMNEARLTALINDVNGLTLNKMWLTQDKRPDRNHETWLNALLFRNGS